MHFHGLQFQIAFVFFVKRTTTSTYINTYFCMVLLHLDFTLGDMIFVLPFLGQSSFSHIQHEPQWKDPAMFHMYPDWPESAQKLRLWVQMSHVWFCHGVAYLLGCDLKGLRWCVFLALINTSITARVFHMSQG